MKDNNKSVNNLQEGVCNKLTGLDYQIEQLKKMPNDGKAFSTVLESAQDALLLEMMVLATKTKNDSVKFKTLSYLIDREQGRISDGKSNANQEEVRKIVISPQVYEAIEGEIIDIDEDTDGE